MGLNSEQKTAVEYLDGPLLVLAGPGTGKTQLLSAKVAYILENTDTNPENILCITFTESGATNMRARLTSMIGKDANKVHIYTYHAFGANILDHYKNYADYIERPMDEPIDQVTQFKIIKEIQQNLPATDINKTAAIKDLVDTIGHAKNNRLTSQDLATIAKINAQDSFEISEAASSHLAQLKGRDKFDYAVTEVYLPILEELAEFISTEPIVNNVERIANIMARELKDIIDTESAKEKPKLKPLSSWKDKYFEKTLTGDYRLKDTIANKKLASLSQIMAKYDEKLKAENLYDFADMIEHAIQLLKDDRGFRLSLSEIFQYILLDEFQDTNPSQAELINLIADYDENPNIMAVGDDDQAIFEFQGANASNLLNFQERYNAKVITLLDNYRSTGEILELSHHIAEQIDNSFAEKHNINKVLRSILDLQQNIPKVDKSKISRHEFISADAEYYWISQEIRKLVDNGENPNDIAIITPKHKYVSGLLPYLQAKKINIAYEKKSNLIEDAKIHQLLVMANFVHDLANGKNATHYLMEILSFVFWQNNPATIIRVMEGSRYDKRKTLDYLVNSENGQLQQIGKFFADLVFQAFNAPLELWLNYLIGETELNSYKSPYLDWYSTTINDGELFEFFSNLNTIRNTITSHIRNDHPKLSDLVNTISDYQNAEASIVSTNPYQDATSAVQIISAHKSKGLEYKHVFIIATDNIAWGTSKGNNNMFSLPKNLVQIRHTGNTDDECLRLFFVAITRAKKHLILTNSQVNFYGKYPARLGYLDEKEEDNDVIISPFMPKAAQQVIVHKEFDDKQKITSSKYHWVSNYQNSIPDIKMLLKPRIENYKLTATDLTNFIDIVYTGPQSVYRDKLLLAPSEPLNSTLAYGNLVHAVFEKITNAKISDEEAIAYFQDEAHKMPLETSEINELIDKGLHSFEKTLHTFRHIIRNENAKAEVNLSSEHLIFENVPITGKIDHISINKKDKLLEIYDFKTGSFHDGKWRSHSTLYKYMLQLQFYKLLLNLSPTYQQYKIEKAHILFVTPDKENEVHDKVYDFNNDDEKEFKKLVKRVHHELTTLNFLENPQLNLASDENRQLKDVKAFVELLLEDTE